MNYYEHHIGDFDKNTSHLSACEDGIYCRLIRRYYDTEKPLEADVALLQRKVRARTKEERATVHAMLAEFFRLEADGWHHDQCSQVIAQRNARRAVGYQQFRALVLARDGAKCAYCGRVDLPLELDHVMPQSRGGNDEPENLTPACKPCNSSKGSRLLVEWRPGDWQP